MYVFNLFKCIEACLWVNICFTLENVLYTFKKCYCWWSVYTRLWVLHTNTFLVGLSCCSSPISCRYLSRSFMPYGQWCTEVSIIIVGLFLSSILSMIITEPKGVPAAVCHQKAKSRCISWWQRKEDFLFRYSLIWENGRLLLKAHLLHKTKTNPGYLQQDQNKRQNSEFLLPFKGLSLWPAGSCWAVILVA